MLSVNNFNIYVDEIELTRAQNRVECDLYSIIACIIRARKQSDKISLREVSTRRYTNFSKKFAGDSSFPDFVVRERIKSNDATTLGAIEAKYVDQNLDNHLEQVKLQLNFYKKIIYTNGITWRYYENCIDIPSWEVVLGNINIDKIEWNGEDNWRDLLDKLDKINWIK